LAEQAVPPIVPEGCQNRTSSANSSQLGESEKSKEVKKLRETLTVVERRISVQRTAAFSLSATSPRVDDEPTALPASCVGRTPTMDQLHATSTDLLGVPCC